MTMGLPTMSVLPKAFFEYKPIRLEEAKSSGLLLAFLNVKAIWEILDTPACKNKKPNASPLRDIFHEDLFQDLGGEPVEKSREQRE